MLRQSASDSDFQATLLGPEDNVKPMPPLPRVPEWEHVLFDDKTRTFRLNAGQSTYAFRINDIGDVEHIYWGPLLNESDDLSYATKSNVAQPFDPAFDVKDVVARRRARFDHGGVFENLAHMEPDGGMFDVWKNYRGALGPASTRANEHKTQEKQMTAFTKRRLENLSWRILAMEKLGVGSPPPAGNLAEMLDGDQLVVEGEVERIRAESETITQQLKSGKNTAMLEYSDYGTGDYRSPSFSVVYGSDGSSISPLIYAGHQIYAGMPNFGVPEETPRVRVGNAVGDVEETGADSCTTLVVILVDDETGMAVNLVYTVFHHQEVILRKVIIRNSTAQSSRKQSIMIQKVMSATIDFEATSYAHWITHFSGSWARERQRIFRKLDHGITSFGSTRGTSSHQHNPFVVISQGAHAPEEDHGNVFGVALMYSGNFLCESEVTDVGRLRMNIGIHPEGFRWTLGPGDLFHSPTAILGFSKKGTTGLSHLFHKLVRERIVAPQWRDNPCPILINSWEAMYFDVTHDALVKMAIAAKQVGIELLVLDDGWFGKRNDATSSLGDWSPNAEKFPHGMRALVDDINNVGLKFGLWIEPEMISMNSDLYQAHPDWCLHVPNRPVNKGRNQLVLDMSRDDVREYIFESIAQTLRDCNVEYVKWDMNRHLTEVYSINLDAQHQGEVLHRYLMGVYKLHKSFTDEFPHIRFEGCSGGGGRFDLGILYYLPQIWASDNTDAMVRLKIQHGTSYLYPSVTVGAHYSVIPNHITQGMSRKRTRAMVAMCGTFGYELDVRQLPLEEKQAMTKHISVFKRIRHIIHRGNLFRLWDPFTMDYCAWMYVLPKTASGIVEEALVFAFNQSSNFWSNLAPRLHLKGLTKNVKYAIHEPLPNNRTKLPSNLQVVKITGHAYSVEPGLVVGGDILMNVGIPVQFFTPDDSVLLHLRKVD